VSFYSLYNLLLIENELGLLEDIVLDGIGTFKAKTDTGNEAYNVLHGTDIKVKDDQVSFTAENNKFVKLPLEEIIDIHLGANNVEKRPVVLINCKINKKTFINVPFSITDRSNNNYKVLLGAPFILKNGGMVDISKAD
jgi:hypothetical protein